MKVSEEKDIRDEEVLEFLEQVRGSTFFHTPAWLECLSRSFPRTESSYLTARRNGGLEGLMPVCRIGRAGLFILSALPFGTYGTPLSLEGRADGELLDALASIASSWRCLESQANLYGAGPAPKVPSGWTVREEECRVVELAGGFERYRSERLSRKKRQICNGCEKEGIVVRPLDGAAELRAFYGIYVDGSREWGGVHPYPFELFESLFARRKAGVVFWGAFLEGEMLGGHVDMYFGRKAQAWQAAMPPEQSMPGVAAYLVYRAVEEACLRGAEEFNLGTSGGDEGMIFFKESMGGVKRTYPVIEKRRPWWKTLRGR